MANERSYCMECVEGRPVALGLCADCLAGEPLEEVIRQIARLSRELEAARAALTIAETTAANLHDTIRLRDRELEAARELIRDLVDDEDAGLVWLGRRLVCAYCTADGLYSVAHAADCPIIRARRALVADTEVSDGGI